MTRIALLSSIIAASVTLVAPREAEACGGTFCDSGPQAMPVDQTGEKILFVMAADKVEAHIQIQYDPDTDAAKFAWVIPLLAVPEFSVGSDPLIDSLVMSTVPIYGFQQQFDSCEDGGVSTAGSSGGSGDSGTGGGDTDGGGPRVVHEEQVGAFQVAVLQGGTSAEVMQWLSDNGYQQDPAAEPILDEYLSEGYLFGAFKLVNGAGVDEIHPVVLTFPAGEACVPLRLTRIAAVEDMEVRTFFLADHRVVPRNYKHVTVNPLRIDWPSLAANYKELITLAVDHADAGSRAFVTEYAGSSRAVVRNGIWSSSWSSAAFETIQPTAVVDELVAQGFMNCWDWARECEYYHVLVRGLLLQYLPVPDGVTEYDFYSCLSCYEGVIDQNAWDAMGFAADLEERVVAPGVHANALLDTWPYLTRMYTTISPHEMTEDPFFHVNPDLPQVDNRFAIATQRMLCNGDAVWMLPDGREVYGPNGTWPTFDGEMPWVEEVEQMPAKGSPMTVADFTTVIDQKLGEHNCKHAWPTAEACGLPGDTDSSGTDGTEGTDKAPGGDDPKAGCACVAGAAPAASWLVMGMVPALVRRRRRS